MDLLNLAIVGTAVSLIVSFIKHYAGTTQTGSLFLTLIVAFVGGTAYYFMRGTQFYQSFLEVLGFANAIYMVLVQFLDPTIEKVVTSATTPPSVPPSV